MRHAGPVRDRRWFEELVARTLDDLPPEFQPDLHNVVVVVREEPPSDGPSDSPDDGELLGLYIGVPLTDRSVGDLPGLPDRIEIFRGPILRLARTESDIRREVRDTVLHELGHHLGLSDEEMPY